MSHPRKAVEKVFRQHGGTRGRLTKNGQDWQFPDGSMRHIHDNIHVGVARTLIREIEERYGRIAAAPFTGYRKARAPHVDLTRCEATPHARERLELMRHQADITMREVTIALTAPARTYYSNEHGSFVWEGDRVAVAARVTDGHTTITTLLWTTNDLWAENPRPEGTS